MTVVTCVITKAQSKVIGLSCFDPFPAHTYDDSTWGNPAKICIRAFQSHMLRSTSHTSHKKAEGFSLLELMLVVTVVMILAAATVPRMMTVVNDISLRYVATDLSGLLQSARMRAVRTNISQAVMAGTLPHGTAAHFIYKKTA